MSTRPPERFGLVISECASFEADYLNGSTFALPLWSGASIAPEHNQNMSLLGATGDQLRAWEYDVITVPSVDDRIERCMSGVGTEQVMCWAELDRYLMEEVVPVVPLNTSSRVFLLSGRVSDWSYSEFGFRPAFDRIALVPGSE